MKARCGFRCGYTTLARLQIDKVRMKREQRCVSTDPCYTRFKLYSKDPSIEEETADDSDNDVEDGARLRFVSTNGP
jgi:hypothetical protein